MDTQDSIKVPTEPTKPTTTPTASTSRCFFSNFMKNHTILQTHAHQIYKFLRYILAIGYIISALCKLPVFYEMIAMGYELYKTKKEQPADQSKEPQSPQMIASAIFLFFGYVLLIVMQFLAGLKFSTGRYKFLLAYIGFFAFYLIFVATAYFAELHQSRFPLAFALFVVQYTLFGYWAIPSPSNWHYQVLKASIGVDYLMFPATFLFFILITKYKERTVNEKSLNERNYNLVHGI